jgi:hypothetical protein
MNVICLYVDGAVNLSARSSNVNVFEPRNQSTLPKWNEWCRTLEISKALDNYVYDDVEIRKLKNSILKHVPDLGTETRFRFIVNFQREECHVDQYKIDIFKRILEPHPTLFIVNNIELAKPNEVVFLNNNAWIHQHHSEKHLSHFLGEIKRNDLGTMKKKFMFLNNHYSKPRFDILKFLYKNGYEKDGNISFNYFDIETSDMNQKQFEKALAHYNIPYPLEYDTYATLTQVDDDVQNRKKLAGINHIGTMNINYRLYFETFFEIITETEHLLRLDGLYLSEKIHKPLKAGNPFIYWGKPELKDILQSYGLSFNSPIYFFGRDEAFFQHLQNILEKDQHWYNDVQREYLDEYLANIDLWNKVLSKSNNEILNFAYI